MVINRRLTNDELAEAITYTWEQMQIKYVHGTEWKTTTIFKLFEKHLESLLVEQLRRAQLCSQKL